MKDKKEKSILTIIITIGVILYAIFGTDVLSELKSGVEEIKENSSEISKGVDGNLKIYYLDVGQGDSILIQTEESNMLIDAGTNESGPKLVDYLNGLGIKELDYVIATHPHEDHIGGMDDIINNFEIDTFFMPDVITTTKTFGDVLDALERKGLSFDIPEIDSSFEFHDAKIDILYTGTDSNDLNNSSIVLKLTYGENKFLFMADAPVSVENKILNKGIQSDVLKVGHHGSEYSTANEFLDEVNPEFAIISVGKNNSYNHPSELILDKLSSKDIKVFRTDLNGSILVISDGTKINVSMLDTKTN